MPLHGGLPHISVHRVQNALRVVLHEVPDLGQDILAERDGRELAGLECRVKLSVDLQHNKL